MREGTIGWAVEQMQDGERVCRSGWNGKGMYVYLIRSWSGAERPNPSTTAPFVAMKTADDKIVPWLCSQTDLLALDWELAR